METSHKNKGRAEDDSAFFEISLKTTIQQGNLLSSFS